MDGEMNLEGSLNVKSGWIEDPFYQSMSKHNSRMGRNVEPWLRVYQEPDDLTVKLTGLECPDSIIIGRADPAKNAFHLYSTEVGLLGQEIVGFDNPKFPELNIPYIRQKAWEAGIHKIQVGVVQVGDQYGLKVDLCPMEDSHEQYKTKVDKFIGMIGF